MVSLILPAYNAERYIGECIDSVLAQTYPDFELLIIDDGSVDATGEICDRYAVSDSRIRVVHTSNRGMSAARNTGLDMRRGDVVGFIDADDAVHPRFIEILLDAMKRTGSDLAAAGYINEGSVDFKTVNVSDVEPRVYKPLKTLEMMLYQKIDSAIWGKLYSSRLFDSLRFVDGLWYEDLQISVPLYMSALSVVRVDAPLYFYRRHSDSFIMSYSLKRFDILKVTEDIEKWAEQECTELVDAARARRFSAAYNVLRMVYNNPQADHSHDNECHRIIKQRRKMILFNPHVRSKNRAGAIISYMGPHIVKLISRISE